MAGQLVNIKLRIRRDSLIGWVYHSKPVCILLNIVDIFVIRTYSDNQLTSYSNIVLSNTNPKWFFSFSFRKGQFI